MPLRGEAAISTKFKRKSWNMKRCFASVLVLSLLSLSALGCAEKSSASKEVKVSTPGGTTTVTVEKEVKKTGDNPPSKLP
jgi:hypothetical protein